MLHSLFMEPGVPVGPLQSTSFPVSDRCSFMEFKDVVRIDLLGVGGGDRRIEEKQLLL